MRSFIVFIGVLAALFDRGACGVARIRELVDDDETVTRVLSDALTGVCIDSMNRPEWWTYQWCFQNTTSQLHYDHNLREIVTEIGLGTFQEKGSRLPFHQHFRHSVAECVPKGATQEDAVVRTADVHLRCCSVASAKQRLPKGHPPAAVDHTVIENVSEKLPCHYEIEVCSKLVCKDTRVERLKSSPQRSKARKLTKEEEDEHEEEVQNEHEEEDEEEEGVNDHVPTHEEQKDAQERVKAMFYHSYDAYMEHAFPAAELRPLSCSGGKFDLIKIPMVTLIDSLDSLVVLGNYTEFRRAVGLITTQLHDFDLDVPVSLFETTIRVLGGLLSAHLMAVDGSLGIYADVPADEAYRGHLLQLSIDLGQRLLPAFGTDTGIPYGTVNLRHGVPKGETEIASTAGAGSLSVEFEVLSRLSGDARFGDAALKAAAGLYKRRSAIGLLGKHIHTRTGKWYESVSGIGSNSDSFYEYLLKAYLLFRDDSHYEMFTETYAAVKEYVQDGTWFGDVDMFSGKSRRHRSENLQAFWPGMEASLGLLDSSAALLNSFYAVWSDMGLFPEEFDYANWQPGKVPVDAIYLLRPELIESTYHHYRATGDRTWLAAGLKFLSAIESATQVECGHASVKNIATGELVDSMPSFFLSETCKYLFLLFDDNNFVHDRGYIFSTEAHPFDPLQLRPAATNVSWQNAVRDGSSGSKGGSAGDNEPSTPAAERDPREMLSDKDTPLVTTTSNGLPLLPLSCVRRDWWNAGESSYKSRFVPISAAKPDGLRASNTLSIPGEIRGEEWIRRLLATKEAEPEQRDICLQSLPTEVESEGGTDSGADGHAEASTALQSIDVNLGPLGEFSIDVYADGFVVNRLQDGNVIEISGVGNGVLLVRNTDEVGSSTLMDDGQGNAVICTVEAIDGSTREVLDSVQCAVAAFGPTALMSPHALGSRRPRKGGNANNKGDVNGGKRKSQEGEEEGTLDEEREKVTSNRRRISRITASGPATAVGAASGGKTSSSDKNPDAPGGGADHDRKGCHAPERKDKWSAWRWLTSGGSGSPPSEKPQAWHGDVVLVDRGECMFEDKAVIAAKEGASALIVANTDDSLFVMVGKTADGVVAEKEEEKGDESDEGNTGQDQEDGVPVSSDKEEHEREGESESELAIPAVMVTSKSGERLRALLNKATSQGVTVHLNVEVQSNPMFLSSTTFGYTQYPQLFVRPRLIHVLGTGNWGVMLSSTNGLEWQLFIASKKDIIASHLDKGIDVTTPELQRVCTKAHLAATASMGYQNLLKRQCPMYVTVGDIGLQLATLNVPGMSAMVTAQRSGEKE